jgi:hypothetical protein
LKLCKNKDFDPAKVFTTLDADQDNILEDHEISKFMKLDLQRVSVDEA